MRILPHIYNSEFSDDELKKAECSDRLYVSEKLFSECMDDASEGETVILRLKNNIEQSLTGALFSIHHDDQDLIYVPSWMYHILEYGDTHICVDRAHIGLCTGLMVQPHTSQHTHAENPLELLQLAFEYYTTLHPGITIPLYLEDGETMHITVLEVRPQTNEPRCLRNCEIELELMRPLDMPLPVPPAPAIPMEEPRGNVLGTGQTTAGKSTRELALEAALKRLKMSQEETTK